MKVALLGNMNNNNFVLLRFLLDKGYDAELLLFENELSHFMPEDDTFNINVFKKRIKTLAWGGYKSFFTTSKNEIRSDLKKYDIIIGSRLAPAYLRKAKIKLDIFIPAGGEIHSLPFFNGFHPKAFIKWILFSFLQKKGIEKNTKFIFWPKSDIDVDNRINKLNLSKDSLVDLSVPMVYFKEYKDSLVDNTPLIQKQIDEIKSKHNYIIGYHSRQNWKKYLIGNIDGKDTDKLFIAFSEFVKKTNSKPCIIALEYGEDVDETKKLCIELGIENYIYWFPKMPRKELMLLLKNCNIIAGEFKRSNYSYGVVFESLALGKALIHKRDPELYSNKSLYPMIFGDSVDNIKNAFLNNNIEKLHKIGVESQTWYKEYCSNTISKIIFHIEEAKKTH